MHRHNADVLAGAQPQPDPRLRNLDGDVSDLLADPQPSAAPDSTEAEPGLESLL